MPLAKLTATGDVDVLGKWARPEMYETWLARLDPADYSAVKAAMNTAINGRDVVRAQYLVCEPGVADQWLPVYDPVWEAMNQDHEMAGKFIGLILWEVMNGRDEQWYFHKIDKSIVNAYNLVEDIQVMEYFRGQ